MFVRIFRTQPYICPPSIASHQATGTAFVTGQSKCDGPSSGSVFQSRAGPLCRERRTPASARAPWRTWKAKQTPCERFCPDEQPLQEEAEVRTAAEPCNTECSVAELEKTCTSPVKLHSQLTTGGCVRDGLKSHNQ